MKLDPKKMEVVKKTVTVAAPTGGIKLSAFDKASAQRLVSNAMGTMNNGQAPAKGKSGQTMGGKATAAQGKGGPTMGQKAAIARGQGGPVAQAIANKLTGKPAASAAAPQEKQEELKLSTFNLPTVVRVLDEGYDPKEVFDVAKKIEQTYGRNSDEFRTFAAGVGLSPSAKGGYGFPGTTYKKPDLRKDTKSYVDTAQLQYGIMREPMQAKYNYAGFGGNKSDIKSYKDVGNFMRYAKSMLEEFGAKPGKRILAKDQKSVEKNSWGGQGQYYGEGED